AGAQGSEPAVAEGVSPHLAGEMSKMIVRVRAGCGEFAERADGPGRPAERPQRRTQRDEQRAVPDLVSRRNAGQPRTVVKAAQGVVRVARRRRAAARLPLGPGVAPPGFAGDLRGVLVGPRLCLLAGL